MAHTDPVPFTEAELRAARARIAIVDAATAMRTFAQVLTDSVNQQMARLAEARRQQQKTRDQRIAAAELYLRRQARPSAGEPSDG